LDLNVVVRKRDLAGLFWGLSRHGKNPETTKSGAQCVEVIFGGTALRPVTFRRKTKGRKSTRRGLWDTPEGGKGQSFISDRIASIVETFTKGRRPQNGGELEPSGTVGFGGERARRKNIGKKGDERKGAVLPVEAVRKVR